MQFQLRFFTAIIILLLNNNYSFTQSGWHWHNPYPQGNTLNDVCMLNDSTIVAVGMKGTIIKSHDRGKSWDVKCFTADIRDGLNSISFANDMIGVVAGDRGTIVFTSDGGENWEKQNSGTIIDLISASCVDTNKYLILGKGRGGLILGTNDRGVNWKMSNIPVDIYKSQFFNEIKFQNTGIGMIIGGNNIILRSTNSGVDWFRVHYDSLTSTNTLNSISYSTTAGWFVTQEYGKIFQSKDNGETWFKHSVDRHAGFNSICTYKDTIIAFGSLDRVQSLDGGETWISSGYIDPIGSTSHYSNTNGKIFTAVGGGGSIYYSSDGFTSMENRVIGSRATFKKIDFINKKEGIAVGYGKTILWTVDSGKTWVEKMGGGTEILWGVDMIDGSTAVVVGSNGTLLMTNDSGQTWRNCITGISNDLLAVKFLNSYRGIATGTNGLILLSTDAGFSWTTLPSGTWASLRGLFFDGTVGYAVGDNAFLYTSDGGSHWSQYSSFQPSYSICVYFKDLQNGYLGGAVGNSYSTTDGGRSWENLDLNFSVSDIQFVDESVGYMIGGYASNNPSINFTTDGGASWERQKFIMPDKIYDIFIFDENESWLVGSCGSILHTDNGGKYITDVGPSKYFKTTPKSFSLNQNYPNPFNPITKLPYAIGQPSHVSIKVYDLFGREVAILVNENKQPGEYVIEWNPSTSSVRTFSSGVYFIRMIAGQYISTIRAIMMK